MVRTQVQLTENQLEALRNASAATRRSVSDLVREGVDQFLAARGGRHNEERIQRAIRVAGKFSSGLKDVSIDHDRHLAEALGH
jgi:hypothetical protein